MKLATPHRGCKTVVMLQMEKGLLLIRKPELHYYTVQLQTHELNSTSCRAHTHTHQAHTPFCKIYLPKQHVESTDQVLMRTDSSPSHSLHNDTSFFSPSWLSLPSTNIIFWSLCSLTSYLCLPSTPVFGSFNHWFVRWSVRSECELCDSEFESLNEPMVFVPFQT